MNDKKILPSFAAAMDEDGPLEPIGRGAWLRVLRACHWRGAGHSLEEDTIEAMKVFRPTCGE